MFLNEDFVRRIGKNKMAMAGLCMVAFLFCVALFENELAPYPPDRIDTSNILAPPTYQHLLGTDVLGRDVLSRIIHGAGVSLSVGFVAVGISTLLGVMLGALSGYYGGALDKAVMRFVDVMLCFPSFFLILAVIAFIGPSIWNIMIVIGITSWMGVARLVRAEFLSIRERDYVQAAISQGASDARIIFLHILPNAMAPILVAATLGIASAVLIESGLSFLGIGVQPPDPSWGNMLTEGKDNIEIAWWLSLFPGMAILITVMGYNMLGEGIRDSLDPRLRR
ncbi:MAG: ABC transporter permease [Deltaproteobacteria bacterium]|nr:ABC transporter permease [Deltaproteobacteria bacterium]